MPVKHVDSRDTPDIRESKRGWEFHLGMLRPASKTIVRQGPETTISKLVPQVIAEQIAAKHREQLSAGRKMKQSYLKVCN